MARQEGTLKLNSNIESRFNAPLDARSRVTHKSELYTLPYAYRGLVVSVTSEDAVYLQIADDHTHESSWKNLGSASGIGAGWGIAKYGTVNITGMTSTAYRSAPVDLSDLSIDSVDDYVILTQPSSEDSISYAIDSTWCRKASTTQAFVYAYSSSKDSCSVDYVVLAKGYGGGGGEDNVIEAIKVYGTEVVPDANKTVSIDVPKMSVTRLGNSRMFDISQSVGGTPDLRDKRLQLEILANEEKVRCEMMLQGELTGTKRFLPTVDYVDEAVSQNVATKTDLYALDNTWRGMIVYVIDEDKYYRLINDLPAFEASWVLYGGDSDFNEITDAEIDAMF